MAKVKVETMAVIDRHPIGSKIELDERTAKRLESMNYVKIIGKVSQSKKATSAPKKTAKAKPKKESEK